jgi:hypothetical protein
MGKVFFSWWPSGHSGTSSGRHTILLDEPLSDLQITPLRVVADGLGLSGKHTRINLRPSMGVRIVLERFTDRHLFRKFSAMINHLERGGWVAFGLDDTKAYAAKTTKITEPGYTNISVGYNITNGYTEETDGSTSLTASLTAPYGDEFVLESAAPQAFREYFTATGSAAGTSDTKKIYNIDHSSSSPRTGDLVRERYPAGSIVRFSDFYPHLYLPAGRVGSAILTHEHRIAYTLDIALEYQTPAYNAIIDEQPDGAEAATTNDDSSTMYDNENDSAWDAEGEAGGGSSGDEEIYGESATEAGADEGKPDADGTDGAG